MSMEDILFRERERCAEACEKLASTKALPNCELTEVTKASHAASFAAAMKCAEHIRRLESSSTTQGEKGRTEDISSIVFDIREIIENTVSTEREYYDRERPEDYSEATVFESGFHTQMTELLETITK